MSTFLIFAAFVIACCAAYFRKDVLAAAFACYMAAKLIPFFERIF